MENLAEANFDMHALLKVHGELIETKPSIISMKAEYARLELKAEGKAGPIEKLLK